MASPICKLAALVLLFALGVTATLEEADGNELTTAGITPEGTGEPENPALLEESAHYHKHKPKHRKFATRQASQLFFDTPPPPPAHAASSSASSSVSVDCEPLIAAKQITGCKFYTAKEPTDLRDIARLFNTNLGIISALNPTYVDSFSVKAGATLVVPSS